MKYNRPTIWLLCACLSGAAALTGCGRRAVVAPSGATISAAEPSPHSAQDVDALPFHFPDDAGGVLLAKVLPPTDIKGPLNGRGTHQRRPSPSVWLDAPPLTLPPSQASPPHPRAKRSGKPLAPHLTVDEALGLDLGDPRPPLPVVFATGGRVRVPSVDASQPIPLPILARPTAERAPLDDPTLEASTNAALAAPMPRRAKPVPYFRVTLPDPFENRRPLGLPLPPEDGAPRTGTIHPPKP